MGAKNEVSEERKSKSQESDRGDNGERTLSQSFETLVSGLRESVSRFQDEQSPENFAGIVTALSGFGLSGADLWKQAASYAKTNPLRTALFAGLCFFALKGMMGRSRRRLMH